MQDIAGRLVDFDPTGCVCCERGHDYVPRGEVRCGLCAEAVYWAKSEVLASRYGGWRWLGEAIRNAAEERAVEQDSELFKGRPRAVWMKRPNAAIQLWEKQQQRRSHSSDTAIPDGPGSQLAVFFIPVPMYGTDLKSDVRQRLGLVFDDLWNQLNISNPKSTGRTPARAKVWRMYIEWLWRERVDRENPADFADEYPTKGSDSGHSVKAVRNGIDRALSTLASY